jgi:hypothetical protein
MRCDALVILVSSAVHLALTLMALGLDVQAARADNFYHPPEWDPQKESLDKVSSLYLQFRYRPGLHGHSASPRKR